MTNTESTNDLAYYAELGFRIFPNHYKTSAGCSCKYAEHCQKPGKHPAIEGYQNLASSEFENLTKSRNLFGGKFRNYDIGALTGFGFFVVDSDKGELEGLPETWKSKSANRGFHYFFKAPSGISIRNIKDLIPGVDIKGQRGYVVLPSEINNREWINSPHEAELADAPTWILKKIQHLQITEEQVYSEISGGFNFPSAGILEEGSRNATLFKYGCYLRSLSLEEDEIHSQLTILNDNRCNPPLSRNELNDITSSVCRYSLNRDLANMLALFRGALSSIPWKGKAGKSDRSILITLLTENDKRYEVLPEGLEISISYRKIAEKAGLTKKAVSTRIKEAPYLRKGKSSRSNKSGTIVILYSLLECVSTTTLSTNNRGGMASVVVATRSLQFNSMRWSNLGKSAVLVLEILLEKPHRRKDLEERLGYRPGGVSGILRKLRDAGLVQSDSRVYSLADDFDERIQPFIDKNGKDIDEIKKVHEGDREHYALRQEAWKRAHDDEAAIQETAEEIQGVYYLMTMNPEAVNDRLRLRMNHHYQQLISELDDQEDDELVKDIDCA